MKKGYFGNIEKETEKNNFYCKVIYTAPHSQLVLMNLLPGEEIGEEVHNVDQFFRFESGKGKSVVEGNEYEVKDGDAIVVPAGSKHNIINTGSKNLKLYTIYSPANHKDGTIHKTKADDTEEHYDGKTTE